MGLAHESLAEQGHAKFWFHRACHPSEHRAFVPFCLGCLLLN